MEEFEYQTYVFEQEYDSPRQLSAQFIRSYKLIQQINQNLLTGFSLVFYPSAVKGIMLFQKDIPLFEEHKATILRVIEELKTDLQIREVNDDEYSRFFNSEFLFNLDPQAVRFASVQVDFEIEAVLEAMREART